MSSRDNNDGYVHDPSGFDEAGTPVNNDSETSDEQGDDSWLQNPVHPEETDREFDWRGWLLVGVIVLAFIVAPVSILLWPPTGANYFAALMILPLVPALLLAVVAVWATTRP